ncbi:glycoside hydrolase family 97 protein [Robertkochia solimangrovi]|uniref:glycoside hydrolase family 97 protein n=1 Tax=Robertkochia solimangrovi TaxID=2213046 RepID=UPI001F552CE9|nr:glycoside hydrolase family 97 protein [Robertkochia solimangrovi]
MKYKRITIVLLLFILSIVITSCDRKVQYSVYSPNHNHEVIFRLSDSGEPSYEINSSGKQIILSSALGFKFMDQNPINTDLEVESIAVDSVDEFWEQPWGEFRKIQDKYNELSLQLKEKGNEGRRINFIFRAFDDGIAFRYHFPEQPGMEDVRITDELTEFTFPSDEEVWWMPVHRENSYYESFYRRTEISATDTINTPATFESVNDKYLAIHEANLTDFASMTLLNTGNNRYKSDLVPWADGIKVYTKAPFNTPWRIVMIGDTPGDLVTSTMMLNLNEPSKIDDTSWIVPSKYIGIWWGMHLDKYTWGQGEKHGATTANTKKYIDFASDNNFDGVLVEGWNLGWDGDWTADGTAFSFTEAYPDFDLDEITKYAASRNVRLIGHHETAGAATHYESQLEDAFGMYEKLGVNAVKTGYVNKYLDKKEWHDSQFGVRHYRKVIETAAKYHIMIDNHEPVKGTGIQRTYPNLMTQEGGRGQEYNAWSPDGGNTPEHTTVMPFTRMLSGPFDFTPGIFDFDYKTASGTRVQTTLAKQLALYVVLFSPQQMAADLPENYEGNPAFNFVRDVPAIWSETVVPDSKIGDYVAIARKEWEGENWYMGVITDENSRKLDIDLNFLGDGKYRAELYTDGEGADYRTDPYPIKFSTENYTNGDKLTIALAPGGGAAIKFIPVTE